VSSEGERAPVISLEEFGACDLDAPIASLKQIDMISIALAYQNAAAGAASPCKDVYVLFSEIARIRLNPADRGAIWTARAAFGNERTMIPSDIRGKQSDILEAALPQIKHPAVRARVADLVWSSDLRKYKVATAAINAYCDCVEGLIDGSLRAADPLGGLNLIDAERPAHRMLQIASATTKNGAPLPNRVQAALASLYGEALEGSQPVIFNRIAGLCVEYKLVDIKRVAGDAETLASRKLDVTPEAIRMTLDFASILYKRLDDTESERRCALAAVGQLLRMRDQVSQAGAKAAWVMAALLRLRHIKGDEATALEDVLEDELRRLQRASLRDMRSFPVDIAVPGEEKRITDLFSDMDFSTALKTFALLGASPKTEDLRAEALRHGSESQLTAMFGVKHLDDEGRTVINTAGTGRGDPPDDWFISMIGRLESFRRAVLVANCIEPARLLIGGIVQIEERHFNPIVWQSGFVPETQAPIWALGFARFFQGDFISAAHLVVPQLEPSLRYILKAHGADPTKRRDDATEEDRSLDAIMVNHRDALVAILTAPLVDELDRLFNLQPGPTLRHDIAHGQTSAGQCYSPDVIYACWFLYRICCLFLIEHWDKRVRPALAIEEPGL
jgi:hypothetical protein